MAPETLHIRAIRTRLLMGLAKKRVGWRRIEFWRIETAIADNRINEFWSPAMLRKTLFLPLMAAAIGVPLLVFSEADPDAKKEGDALENEISLAGLDSEKKQIYEPIGNLAQIFDFNLRPEQIEGRWKNATKSTLNGYQIYRTSMLSGHGPSDLVGALTYQFDQGGRLRKIDFSGYVGDPSMIVEFVTSRFGFARTDQTSREFRPTAFAGHSGSLKLNKGSDYGGQFKIDLSVSR